jgi:hypothetical protein
MSGSSRDVPIGAVITFALAVLVTGCGAHTFAISGNYLYPAPPGASSDAACRGAGSSEGQRLHVSVVGQKHVYEVVHGTLGPGRLDTTSHAYGITPLCVYPFTIGGIPAGRRLYEAAVGNEPGTGFAQSDNRDVTIEGLPPGDKQGGM